MNVGLEVLIVEVCLLVAVPRRAHLMVGRGQGKGKGECRETGMEGGEDEAMGEGMNERRVQADGMGRPRQEAKQKSGRDLVVRFQVIQRFNRLTRQCA